MSFHITELAGSYQYPLIAFSGDQITWANPSALLFLGKSLEPMTLSGLIGAEASKAAQDAFESRDYEWRLDVFIGETPATVLSAFINDEGYLAVKPRIAEGGGGFLHDRILSDMGQLMKEPLSDLFVALQQIEKYVPDSEISVVALAKRSFYSLACLSEKQVAFAPPTPLDDNRNKKLMPIKKTVISLADSANEALLDRDITIRVDGDAPEKLCRLYEKKFIRLMMLLFSYAIHGLPDGSVVSVAYGVTGDDVTIEIPVTREMISLFDFSGYMNVAGTELAQDPLENQLFTMIAGNFNLSHSSKIFSSSSNGVNLVVISLKSENPGSGVVNVPHPDPEQAFGGLSPELMFLSGELKTASYI